MLEPLEYKNITLTIDEIHSIREEHSRKTKDMNFDEYKKVLDAEIAPVLLLLNLAREKNLESAKIE